MKNTTHLLLIHLIRNHNNLYPAWPFRCAVIVCINIWIPIINSEYILSEGRKRFIEKKFSLRARQPGKTNFIEAILKVPQNLIIQSIQQLQLSSESNYYSTQWRCNRYIIVTWRRSFTEKLVKIWSAAFKLYVDMELTETFDLGDKTTFFRLLEPSLPPGPTSNLRSKRIALFNELKKVIFSAIIEWAKQISWCSHYVIVCIFVPILSTFILRTRNRSLDTLIASKFVCHAAKHVMFQTEVLFFVQKLFFRI